MKVTYDTIHTHRATALASLAKSMGASVKRVPVKHEISYCSLIVAFEGSFPDAAPKMRRFQACVKAAAI